MIYKRSTALERSVKIFHWRAEPGFTAPTSPLVQMWIKTHRQADFVQHASLTGNINSMAPSTNIIQYVAKWYVRKIIDHYCSVVPEKNPTLGSKVKWETRQASFPAGTVGPRIWIFQSPLNTNDEFYLSHIPVPALGKDIKTNSFTSVARWPHVDP